MIELRISRVKLLTYNTLRQIAESPRPAFFCFGWLLSAHFVRGEFRL